MDPVRRLVPPGAAQDTTPLPRDHQIAALAARQGGVVSRAQLRGIGFSNAGISARVDRGLFHPVHRGVFAVGRPGVYGLGLEFAALLACGPGAVRAVRSAGEARDLRTWSSRTVEVIAGAGQRSKPGINVYRHRLHPDEVSLLDGIPTTTVERTLFDLAEVLPAEPFKRTWESGVRDDLIDVRALRAVAARNPGRRALKAIRPLLETRVLPGITDTRSPLEVDFVEFAAQHLSRFGPPSINHSFGDFVLDAYYEPAQLAIELDSREFHLNPISFETDRAKQAACLAAGVVILPLTSRRLRVEPLLVAEQLTTILAARWRATPLAS